MVGTCFGGPCSIMTFSYVKILKEFRASRRRIANDPALVTPSTNQNHVTEKTRDFRKQDGLQQNKFKSIPKGINNRILAHQFTRADILNENANEKALKRRQEDLRLAWSFLVVILSFVLSWLPFCVTMFCSVFLPFPVPRIPDMITLLLGCMNSAYNPIIYGVLNKRFRTAFRKLFCKLCDRQTVVSVTQTVQLPS